MLLSARRHAEEAVRVLDERRTKKKKKMLDAVNFGCVAEYRRKDVTC
jgi:hypothetical protein